MTRGRAPHAAVVAIALATLAGSAPALACDSTACAIATRATEGAFVPGQWRVDLSVRYIDQSRRREGSQTTAEVLRPRVDLAAGRYERSVHHELQSAMSVTQLEVSRALARTVSLNIGLPLFHRASVDHLHYAEPPGTAPAFGPDHGHSADVPLGAAFALRDAASGIGDLRLGIERVVFSGARHDLTAGLTLKLPTGRSRMAASDGVIDPMLQPGTGSTDVAASAQYVRRFSAATMAMVASAQKTTTNGDRYRHGDEALVALGATRSLGTRVTGTVQLKLHRVGRHLFMDGPVPSTGATLVQVAPALRFRTSRGLSIYGSLQLPAYLRVNERQLAPRVTLTAGVSKAFGSAHP